MGTHFFGDPLDVQALDTFIKLIRAAGSVGRYTRAAMEAAGLTESQFAVLDALFHLGPLTPGELGRKILKTAGNLTTVIDNLERDGLVKRFPTPDRRKRPVALTQSGHSLFESILPDHVRGIRNVMSILTASEQAALAGLCRKLGRGLEESDGSVSAR